MAVRPVASAPTRSSGSSRVSHSAGRLSRCASMRAAMSRSPASAVAEQNALAASRQPLGVGALPRPRTAEYQGRRARRPEDVGRERPSTSTTSPTSLPHTYRPSCRPQPRHPPPQTQRHPTTIPSRIAPPPPRNNAAATAAASANPTDRLRPSWNDVQSLLPRVREQRRPWTSVRGTGTPPAVRCVVRDARGAPLQPPARAAIHAHVRVPQNPEPRLRVSRRRAIAAVEEPLLNRAREAPRPHRARGGSASRAAKSSPARMPPSPSPTSGNHARAGAIRADAPQRPPPPGSSAPPETPASSKVAISSWTAASTSPIASAAPVPSPNRSPRSSRGRRPRCSARPGVPPRRTGATRRGSR